jgi:hypothetical protein
MCGTNGWRMLGSSMDSGIGHGDLVTSIVYLSVNTYESGYVTFNWELLCGAVTPTCQLTFRIDEMTVAIYKVLLQPNIEYVLFLTLPMQFVGWNTVANFSIPNAGPHYLSWSFAQLGGDYTRTDRAIVSVSQRFVVIMLVLCDSFPCRT